MKKFTFNVHGSLITVTAKDVDRARCTAKQKAGSIWTPKARLVKICAGGAE